MTDEWIYCTLGELIEIKHGFAFKGAHFHEEPCGDILLTPGNFAIGGGFKGDRIKYYDGPVPEDYVLREGDVLVTMTDLSKQSDTLGYPAFVPASSDRRFLHNQRLGKILLKNKSMADPKFLYHVMCTSSYRHEVLASATGTTVKHTSPDRIKKYAFLLPPLPQQRAIAHILGTLDDKIELNRRMNETLEEMARALFKSWFVDFDPVRAKMEGRWRRGQSLPGMPAELYDLFPDGMVRSELGEIPEGWEVEILGNVANEVRVSAQPHSIEPGTPYIALEHMPKRCLALSDWGVADEVGSNKFRFERGNILFGKLRPYFHRVGIAPLEGVCSTDIVVVALAADCWFGLVLGHVSSDEFVDYTDTTSTGTRMPRTKWRDMARYTIALPTRGLAEAFTMQIQPWVKYIVSAIHESHALAALRDTLLPGLVSGEVRVGEIEELEESVPQRKSAAVTHQSSVYSTCRSCSADMPE